MHEIVHNRRDEIEEQQSDHPQYPGITFEFFIPGGMDEHAELEYKYGK
jgi:hypothetical protein